jgi:uncharacterized membrane protein YkoI
MARRGKILSAVAPTLAVATLAVAATTCDEDSTTTTSSPQDSVREAEVGLGDAIAAAQDRVGSGITVAAEYELSKDGAEFEVEILVDGEVREVLVDPSDGRVLEVKVDPEDLKWATAAAARLAASDTTLAKAVEIAEVETNGTAYEVELGKDGIKVEVLTGDARVEVKIALEDGHVVAVEEAGTGFRSAGDEDDDEGEDEDDDDEDDDE